ncbi:N-acyl-aromatic-L-amino acid amidohydrolase (carboxylate-forming) [Crotalus tigris]|uniref:N-acyl-aromatic-L-amino acid amidohydrolase (carboxylate-forming) n=1 Tax=Crotalus tigris TaxID=88082 RepID=UPI00192F7BB7|nr:N-acyl-aromatic-L-amino acid amidohydrolase (carboxylate-forming) [Crotalus tigris]XP_039196952.1 N-acyl-aromatic-L-amino acid amidohydrolase (carboxylate-forming) [Crotalus tigris]XP_039196953.1 N-acyl-aromatic-L-amino acid amidohydrolase (carboxylate-forming) [Crotalus tigris]
MSHPEYLPPLGRVAICGGTHGNEMSGVYLVKHWLQDPSELQRSTFQVTPLVGNPRAVERCVRYVGRDLNRTFAAAFLNTKASDSDLYEIQRAQEINQIFGPKGSSQAYDFMLDLHNTTANMGSCLLLKSEFSLLSIHMCNYIQKHCRVRHCPILLCQLSGEETTFMMSVAKHGLALELGPQPQGVARADQLAKMRSIVVCALDFIELFNKGTLFPAFEIEAYRPVEQKDFPRYPNGEISAVIHPNLQDKDFQPLKPGDPVFQNFVGEDILHDGDDTFFPVFINEAAYYEKKIAFWKTKKETFTQPALQKTF